LDEAFQAFLLPSNKNLTHRYERNFNGMLALMPQGVNIMLSNRQFAIFGGLNGLDKLPEMIYIFPMVFGK